MMISGQDLMAANLQRGARRYTGHAPPHEHARDAISRVTVLPGAAVWAPETNLRSYPNGRPSEIARGGAGTGSAVYTPRRQLCSQIR